MFEDEHLPLSDELDRDILMHRDAHFGGQFSEMIDYYMNEGRGVQPHFDLRRIEELKKMEDASGENLAPLLLSGADAERIRDAKEMYKKLRTIYETEGGKKSYPLLIADLILVEDESEEEAIILKIAEEKNKIIPPLLDLLKSEEFRDPLFPGYGHAPFLAAKCLGEIGDKRVVISLFHELGSDESFSDEGMIVSALKAIGAPAKEFLLKVLIQKPWGEENERASFALAAFSGDEDLQKAAITLLEDPAIFSHEIFASYVLLLLEGLKEKELIRRAEKIVASDRLPRSLKMDAEAMKKTWLRT